MFKVLSICGRLVICLVILQSCGRADRDDESQPDLFPAFTNFPASQFYGIRLGQSFQEVQDQLAAQEFEKIDSSGASTFLRETDSMEFILPDKTPVTAFKVFLRSARYCNHRNELMLHLKGPARTASESDRFSVFTYYSGHEHFKLSVFSQAGYLRLSFEQQLRK